VHPIYGFLLLVILAACFAAWWISALAAFLLVRWRNWPVARTVAGVALLVLTAGGLSVAGITAYEFYRSSTPRLIYEDTFGEKPTADVRDLRGGFDRFEERYDLWFQTDRVSFERIRQKRFVELDRVSLNDYRGLVGEGRIEGLSPTPTLETEIYLTHPPYGKGKHFAHESACLTFDTETGAVQFHLKALH
jgi:hypothetical protein